MSISIEVVVVVAVVVVIIIIIKIVVVPDNSSGIDRRPLSAILKFTSFDHFPIIGDRVII